jgi:riboflavin biosynthesis pyrimidine reductase
VEAPAGTRLRLLHRAASAGADVSTALDVGCDETRQTLVEWYEPPKSPWLRLNLIAAVSGDAAGTDGTSETLSNRVDRAILAAIREVADAVVVGAASVRAEGYRVPARARLVIVTSSGDLAGHRILPDRASRVVVVCPGSAVRRVHESLGQEVADLVTIVTAGDVDGRVEPAALVAGLAAHGLRSLVCEGGPSLAGQFLSAGLVDELCLSTSPVVIGSGLPVFGTERFGASRLSLTQLLVDDQSALYARWKVERDEGRDE